MKFKTIILTVALLMPLLFVSFGQTAHADGKADIIKEKASDRGVVEYANHYTYELETDADGGPVGDGEWSNGKDPVQKVNGGNEPRNVESGEFAPGFTHFDSIEIKSRIGGKQSDDPDDWVEKAMDNSQGDENSGGGEHEINTFQLI